MRYRLLGVAVILGIAFGIFVGVYSAIGSLYQTRDRYYSRLNVDDLEVRFIPTDRSNVPNFTDIPGVSEAESRLVSPGQLTLADGSRHATAVVAEDLSRPTDINRLQVLSGSPLSRDKPNAVLVDRNFANYHGVKPGDHIVLAMGNAKYSLTVAGIALSPEHLIAPANPNFFVPVKGSVGVVFAPLKLISDRMDFPLVNSEILTFRKGADPHAVENAVRQRASTRLDVQASTLLPRQFSYLFMKVDLGAFQQFVPAVIVVFLLATVTVGLFLIARWIAAQKQTLGVFMALGFKKRRLITAQLYPALLIALAAIIVGIPVAYLVLADFGRSYSKALGFPKPFMHLDPLHLGMGIAGVVIIVALISLWPLSAIMRLTPQDAVRGDSPRSGGRAGGAVMRALGALRRWPTVFYPLRSLARVPGVAATTLISIGLALGVSLSYLIATNSFNHTIAQNFNLDRWNVAVGFLVPLWEDELGPYRKISGVDRLEGYLRGAMRVEHAGTTQPALMTGVPPQGSMHHITITDGRGLKAHDKDVILLEHKLAHQLNAKPGDTLALESQGHRYSATVVGIFSGTIPGAAYAPLASVQHWLQMDGQVTGVLVKTRGHAAAVAKALSAAPRVGSVTLKSQLSAKVREISSEASSIIYVATAFSIAVTLIILLSSTSFTVLGRRHEYGVLRTLGFRNRVVGRILMTEVSLVGVFGLLLSVLFAYGMATFLIGRLSQAWFEVIPSYAWWDFALIGLPALVLFPIAALPSLRVVLRTRLSLMLRDRRIG